MVVDLALRLAEDCDQGVQHHDHQDQLHEHKHHECLGVGERLLEEVDVELAEDDARGGHHRLEHRAHVVHARGLGHFAPEQGQRLVGEALAALELGVVFLLQRHEDDRELADQQHTQQQEVLDVHEVLQYRPHEPGLVVEPAQLLQHYKQVEEQCRGGHQVFADFELQPERAPGREHKLDGYVDQQPHDQLQRVRDDLDAVPEIVQVRPAYFLHLVGLFPHGDRGQQQQQFSKPDELVSELREDYFLVEYEDREQLDEVQDEEGLEDLGAHFLPDHLDRSPDAFVGEDLDPFLFREHVQDQLVAHFGERLVVGKRLDLGRRDGETVVVLPACVVLKLCNREAGFDHALHVALEVLNLVKRGLGHELAHEVHDVLVTVLAAVLQNDVLDAVENHVDGAEVVLAHEVQQLLAHH